MNVAKPPRGFRIQMSPAVRLHVDDTLDGHPELIRPWNAVLARLKASGHILGQMVGDTATRRWAVLQPTQQPARFKLAWQVKGDTLTIIAADF